MVMLLTAAALQLTQKKRNWGRGWSLMSLKFQECCRAFLYTIVTYGRLRHLPKGFTGWEKMKRFEFLVINESFRGSDRRIIFWVLLLSACEATSQAREGWEGSTQPPRENPTNRGVHRELSPDTHHGRQAGSADASSQSTCAPGCSVGLESPWLSWMLGEEALFRHRHYSHWGHRLLSSDFR